MTVAENLRNVFDELRPLMEQQLDTADLMAGLRDAASEKGLDWSQLKALAKATVQDERDGGERVKKLTDKADLVSEYADLLSRARANKAENKNSPPQSNAVSLAGGRTGHSPMRAGCDDNAPAKEVATEIAEKIETFGIINAIPINKSPSAPVTPAASGAPASVPDANPAPAAPDPTPANDTDFNDTPPFARRTPDGGFVEARA